MKSILYNQSDGIDFILSKTEKIGEACDLTPSETMKLRLLTEEVLGLTVRLFENIEYDLFIENEGRFFTINLTAATRVNLSQKNKMLSLSSEGKNKATKGVLGKISGIFEDAIMGAGENDSFVHTYSSLYSGGNSDIYFSLTHYQNQIPEDEKAMEWDGLEKSIIAHIADDVTIGVKSDNVEVIATITF